MQLMQKEDCQFLESQRKIPREGKMAGLDKSFILKANNKSRRQAAETARKEREKEACMERFLTSGLEALSTSSSSISSLDSSSSEPPMKKNKNSPIERKTVITPKVAAALDRSIISNRGAMTVLVPFASALGSNVDKLGLSYSTIRRQRCKHREEKAAEIREFFSPTIPLTLHWDGKLMPSLTNDGTVDRLPIIVSGEGVLKLLAAPITDGKAEPTANTISNVVKEWGLVERIAALCFDTTATNSGSKGGVCLRLQQIFGQDLLHLACRHHILEILLESVFSKLIPEVSRGPEISIFQLFKAFWPCVDTTQYQIAGEGTLTESWANEVLDFCQNQLHLTHPRDDYKEFLELVVIFLGGVPYGCERIVFRKPGALHRARWMARAIYGLKMWIFLPQFSKYRQKRPSSSRAEHSGILKNLGDFCIFLAKHYIRPWFTARSAISAPRHDIALMKALEEDDNEIIRNSGTKALARHLWYLSEINVGMGLFDNELCNEEKQAFTQNMKTVAGSDEILPRLQALPSEIKDKTVSSFANKNTNRFFDLLNIDTSFFNEDPANWKNNISYQAGQQRVQGLLVTNDCAERGVALVQEFTKSGRTKDEDQLQFLLQVVEDHRKKFPSRTKSHLMK